MEKLPQHNRIPSKTNHITQHQLRPQPPPKKPKVTRMSRKRIHPIPHQHMALVILHLHRVVEVTPRLGHGQRADYLSQHHQQHPDYHGDLDPVDIFELERVVSARGEEAVRDETLDHRGAVREVIRPSVRGEEEGGDRSLMGVIFRGSVEFEEVEET